MCTSITLDEKRIDIIINALMMVMGDINTKSILKGGMTDKMKSEYQECEKTLDILNAAKENLNDCEVMAKEK